MSDLFLLSERQMARISPHFPLAHGVPRVDDRRGGSGIVSVLRNGLQGKDAPKAYVYRQRHKVETMFATLKDWRRIATRYDRCAHTFFSAICIAAAVAFYLN